MGIDAGFDMVPRLSRDAIDRDNWKQFIDLIQLNYISDSRVEIKPNYILFKTGEHPQLPFEGHKFLRFSSKVSGAHAKATNTEKYIDTVTKIAKNFFGSRVQYWDEAFDMHGQYDWAEVHESIRSYKQQDEPETPSDLMCSLKKPDSCQEVSLTLFEVQTIPGKGRGLIAKCDIPEGTMILCEKPLLIARPMPHQELDLFLAAELKALPKAAQRQFLTLHNKCPGRYPFCHTFRTNALPCGSGSIIGGVYPTICFINHSCIPNSQHSWNSEAEHETIYAIRPIKAGEEITISYDRGGTASERRAFLKEAFDFDCHCRGCNLSPPELQASNARRLQIRKLDDAIGNPYRMASKPQDALSDCSLMLRILKDEYHGYAGVLNARLYYDAFQISIAHGDQARASIFAQRAYKIRVTGEGEDSPETKKVKSLALKPSSHSSFEMCSKNWKMGKGMVPKNLDEDQFEVWLFRGDSVKRK